MVGLEGGGHQQVFPRRQCETLGHLPHVDVGPATSLGRVVAEEILPLLVFVVWSLNGQEMKRYSVNECDRKKYKALTSRLRSI